MAETPDLTLAEIAVHLQRAHGLRVALSTVRRFSERHGVSVKKKTARVSEQERPDVFLLWHARFEAKPDLDPDRLIFID